MVDAVASVAKIVGVALKIKEAANTARQNKKDCNHIKSRVDVLNKTLSHHKNNEDLMEDPAVMAALEALHGILAEALEVITECHEKRNIICVYCAAGNLSRQLSKVEQRITYLSSDAMLTIMSYQLLRKFEEGAPNPPLQMSKKNQNEANKKDHTQAPPMARPNYYRANKKDQTQASRPVPCSSSDVGSRHKMVGQPRSLENRIAEVARNIKEAAETVLKNNDECLEIGELVNKVSTLLSQLEGKKMVDEPAMRGALEKLLATFRCAHTLVIACQRRGLTILWFSRPFGGLSTQLHEVMDQIASNIADMTAIVLA